MRGCKLHVRQYSGNYVDYVGLQNGNVLWVINYTIKHAIISKELNAGVNN